MCGGDFFLVFYLALAPGYVQGQALCDGHDIISLPMSALQRPRVRGVDSPQTSAHRERRGRPHASGGDEAAAACRIVSLRVAGANYFRKRGRALYREFWRETSTDRELFLESLRTAGTHE